MSSQCSTVIPPMPKQVATVVRHDYVHTRYSHRNISTLHGGAHTKKTENCKAHPTS